MKSTRPSERRPTYDLLSLQRLLEESDASPAALSECARSNCKRDREGAAPGYSCAEDPVLVCDAEGTIVDVHRCGSGADVAALAGLRGRPFSSIFGQPVMQRIAEAFRTEPRVTLTAYLFDDGGLLLRTEMCCWALREGDGTSSGMAAMLHDVLVMEEFERRLGARMTRLLERNLALEGALVGQRTITGGE